jgi:hypothetical protein
MMGAVSGGVPLNNPATPWATGPVAGGMIPATLAASDYSSASLTWSGYAGYGWYVYQDNALVASIPNTMTSVTIGGLTPGTTYSFYVVHVGADGGISTTNNRVTVTTTTLPGGLTITDISSSPGTGSSTFNANVLIPYGLVHLYIWDAIGCDLPTDPGWPVNFVVDDYVCTHYMVEGTNLYSYTGTIPAGTTNAPWAWTQIGTITLDITGYTYTWALPIGTSVVDTSKFLVQATGYNPYTTVFSPDPTDYDCKGSSLCTTPGLLSWCDIAVNNLARNDSLSYNTKLVLLSLLSITLTCIQHSSFIHTH